MKIEELITALRRLKVETGSLPCLGCGYEHGCSLHGCVIINEALERITMLKEHFSEESALKMAAQALETTPEALRQSAQFHAGDTVWVLTRDEDGVPNDVDGYMLLAVAGNAVIVTSFVDDQDDLDSTLAYHFYKCTEEGDIVQNSGKKLQRFCFYCLATPRIKKIGTVASWTGTTPPWCPKGRG